MTVFWARNSQILCQTLLNLISTCSLHSAELFGVASSRRCMWKPWQQHAPRCVDCEGPSNAACSFNFLLFFKFIELNFTQSLDKVWGAITLSRWMSRRFWGVAWYRAFNIFFSNYVFGRYTMGHCSGSTPDLSLYCSGQKGVRSNNKYSWASKVASAKLYKKKPFWVGNICWANTLICNLSRGFLNRIIQLKFRLMVRENLPW